MSFRQYHSPYAARPRRMSVPVILLIVFALLLSGAVGTFIGAGASLDDVADRFGLAARNRAPEPTQPAVAQQPEMEDEPEASSSESDSDAATGSEDGDESAPSATQPPTGTGEASATETPAPSPTPEIGPPEDAAQAFLDAWADEDYDALYDILSADVRGSVSRLDFVDRYEAISAEAGVMDVEATVTDGATLDLVVPFEVTLSLSTVGKVTERNTLQMVREPDGWKVAWSPSLIFAELGDGCVDYIVSTVRRGSILDRNGKPLAIDGEAGVIGVVPGNLTDEDPTIAQLSELIDVPADEIKATYADADPAWFVPVKQYPSEVSTDIISAISEMPGVQVRTERARLYPLGEKAAHITGYVTRVTQEDLDDRSSGVTEGVEWIGRAGIEAGANDLLSGVPGGRLAIVDCDTRAERAVIGERRAVEPKDLLLTIDRDFQTKVYNAIGDVRGSAVIMDPRTGAVMAMASRPSYDPNWFVGGFTGRQLDFINNETERPLLNRAADASYPTGSIFKVITMAAGMKYLKLDGESTVECPQEWSLPGTDQVWRDWTFETGSPPQGAMSLHNALVNSCNTVFYQMGADLDTKSEQYLPDMARAFGLGEATGIPYLSEVAGIVPDPEWKQKNIGDFWARGDAVNLSIGQGFLEATPLQMTVAYAAIANGGSVLTPFIVEFTRDGDGALTRVGKRDPKHKLPLERSQIRDIQSALRDQTSNEWGAGSAGVFKDFDWPIAGKTGTAQNQMTADQKPHGWFAAYGPYGEKATIASVVMVETSGEGVVFASPPTRTIYEAYLKTNLMDEEQ